MGRRVKYKERKRASVVMEQTKYDLLCNLALSKNTDFSGFVNKIIDLWLKKSFDKIATKEEDTPAA